MTDTIDKFGSGVAAVQQMANTPGDKQVFDLKAMFVSRGINPCGINLGTGFDGTEK